MQTHGKISTGAINDNLPAHSQLDDEVVAKQCATSVADGIGRLATLFSGFQPGRKSHVQCHWNEHLWKITVIDVTFNETPSFFSLLKEPRSYRFRRFGVARSDRQ